MRVLRKIILFFLALHSKFAGKLSTLFMGGGGGGGGYIKFIFIPKYKVNVLIIN